MPEREEGKGISREERKNDEVKRKNRIERRQKETMCIVREWKTSNCKKYKTISLFFDIYLGLSFPRNPLIYLLVFIFIFILVSNLLSIQ